MGTLAYAGPAADPAVKATVGFSADVVSCDAFLENENPRLLKVLREGTEISVTWEINVQVVRRYWLNRTIATVTISHRVVPDLVSRSWRLVDLTSGISQRVFDLKQAVRFLTQLERFPVIDRSLLEKGWRYRMKVEAEENEGNAERSWLSGWLGYNRIVTGVEFVLP